MQEYGRDIISRAKAGDLTEYLNKGYEKCILALMKYDYAAQTSLLTEADIKVGQKAFSRYKSHASFNPRYVLGAPIGGVYRAVRRPGVIAQYIGTYNGKINNEELATIQRFTNGSTFSNIWNLSNSSNYWKKKAQEKKSLLTQDEWKEFCQLTEDYSRSANMILDKMERYCGITFRGLRDEGATELKRQIEECYTNGTPWVNNASASTSTRFSVAKRFDDDLILLIHNKSSAYIHPISEYSTEYEVMTLRGTKYNVLGPPRHVNGRYLIELEEI